MDTSISNNEVGDDQEVPGLLYSVSSSSAEIESILPVQLDPEEYKSYTYHLFPPAKTPKGFSVTRGQYVEAYQYMTEISAIVNFVLAQARYIFKIGPGSEVLGATTAELGNKYARHWGEMVDAFTPTDCTHSFRDALKICGQGNAHIIVPSTRYENGFDVIFSGSPGQGYAQSSAASHTPRMSSNPLNTEERDYDSRHFESQQVIIASQIVDVLRDWLYMGEVGEILGGKSDAERIVSQHDVVENMWNVEELQNSLDSLMQANGFPSFGRMPMIPELPAKIAEGLSRYTSVCIVREPYHPALSREINPIGIGVTRQPLAPYVSRLSGEFAFCLALNLPQTVCHYITQTAPGKQPPLTSLNTWVSTWAEATLRPRGRGKKNSGGALTVDKAPRYILRPSELANVAKRRKEMGLYTEPGRSNDDGLFVSDTGRFHYCGNAAEAVLENAANYEEMQERALAMSFNVGSPLMLSRQGTTSSYFAHRSKEYAETIRSLKDSLKTYAGALQGYSWDYNCILTSNVENPDRLRAIPLQGASRPDELSLSEYLTMRTDNALFRLFPGETVRGENEISPRQYHNLGIIDSSIFDKVFKTYRYMLYQGTAPDFQELVTRSAKALGYTTLNRNEVGESAARYEVGLYAAPVSPRNTTLMADNFIVTPTYDSRAWRSIPRPTLGNSPEESAARTRLKSALDVQINGIKFALAAAMRDAAAGPNSNLMSISQREGSSYDDDEHFYAPDIHGLGDLANVYNYLGGQIFYQMLKTIADANIATLAIVDPLCPVEMPPFEIITKTVKPFALMLAKYAPMRSDINAKAAEMSAGLKRDHSITTSDIKMPGTSGPDENGKGGFQMFPHQVETFQVLAQEKPPRFAVLDIAPGGGKTIIGLTDIGQLIHRGAIKRPLVVAPNGLVRNWVEDLHSVTKGKWNIVPITRETFDNWGDDELTEMITKAPINTVFVVGISFLTLRTYQVVIGNHAEKVSATLEFCRKFGFDYLIMDESHKAKNDKSYVHKAIKQLTVSSTVKFVRLATGTLVQNKLSDVIGQAALFSGHIFRTRDEFETENRVEGTKAVAFTSATISAARAQLAKHAAVISYKRKEWAFMLPRPMESFIQISLDDGDRDEGKIHRAMYEAILKQTVEEIEADEKLMSLLAGKDIDGNEEGADDPDSDSGDSEDGGVDVMSMLTGGADAKASGKLSTTAGGDPIDDTQMAEIELALNPYLQRLEMLLTDPVGDPEAEQFMRNFDRESFVSAKVLAVIDRIGKNFIEYPWKKGTTYKVRDIADYNGQRYALHGPDGAPIAPGGEKTYHSVTPPNQDARWKPEAPGKVIVFCRYTRSVNAIYRALPPHLKKLAVRFCPGVMDKWGQLEKFRRDKYSTESGAQILIANEQAISEGHNLQMASRLIRVECPWSPGELDQSSSRIFRPDTSGEYRRETIFLDWIITNNTMEVAKLGRLVSRILDKVKFDEDDNPLYAPLKERDDLLPIAMTLENLAEFANLDSIGDYLSEYQKYVNIQSYEFDKMRYERDPRMEDIDPTPMPEGSARMKFVPYLPTQRVVPMMEELGLTKLTAVLEDEDSDDSAKIRANPKGMLPGMYVHTERGNGVIKSVRKGKGPGGITSVDVWLAGSKPGDKPYRAEPALIYLAEKVDSSNIDMFESKFKFMTDAQRKREEEREAKIEAKRRREEEQEAEKQKRNKKRMQKEAELAQKKIEDDNANKKKGGRVDPKTAKTPVNAPKKPNARKPEPIDDPLTLTLEPVVYNGYLALEAEPGQEDEKDMLALGFKETGAYAWIHIVNHREFEAVLDLIESKFHLRAATRNRLHNLSDSFAKRGARNFKIERAPLSEFKNFFRIAHKPAQVNAQTGKTELLIYPVARSGSLFLYVDLATNPKFKRFVGKVIPNAGTDQAVFEASPHHYLHFFKSVNEVIRWYKDSKAKFGMVVENDKQFRKDVTEMEDVLIQHQGALEQE